MLGYGAPSGANNGTVVALTGGSGTSPATAAGGEVQALEYYLANHLEVVQVEWNSDWEAAQFSYPQSEPYGNILNAACRPAGILNAVHNNPLLFNPGGAMCAQGFSAGSAAVVYTLSWFGAGWGTTGYIDNVELLSGPVLSRVDYGCEVPVIPNAGVCNGAPGCTFPPNTQSWFATEEYVDGDENYARSWSNISQCANNSGINTAQWNSVWDGMSILSPSITSQMLSYPKTSMNAWICGSVYNNEETMNNSSSQGWLFYQQATWSSRFPPNVNAVINCHGNEGIYGDHATGYDGVVGGAAMLVEKNMVAQCVTQH